MFRMSACAGVDSGSSLTPSADDLIARILAPLADGPLDASDLRHSVVEEGGHSAWSFWHTLNLLSRAGRISTQVVTDGRVLLTIRGALPQLLPAIPQGRVVLSRFAGLRSRGGELVVESPFGPATVALSSDEAAAFCSRLARGFEFGTGGATTGHEDTGACGEMLLAFDSVGLLDRGGNDALDRWEPHDAMFHAVTRGRTWARRGGTYRFLGAQDPQPARRTRPFGVEVELEAAPATSRLTALEELLAGRRSIREYDQRPLAAGELKRFLSMVARVRGFDPVDEAAGRLYETVHRAFPSGGACHELELFPLVYECEGLDPGAYWYDSFADRLQRLPATASCCERIQRRAAQSMGIHPTVPQIVIVVAARFGRMNWKYEGIAYATILKDLGALIATMYLVATAMDLAPCAIGSGESMDFGELTGLPTFEEDAVGEVALGRARP